MRIERARVKWVGGGATGGAAARERWAAAIGDGAWMERAEVLKEGGAGSWVRGARLDGRDVVVKCQPRGGFVDRVKRLARWGRGLRHVRGMKVLGMRGVRTAAVYALADARVDGRWCELIVMERLRGVTLLEEMAAAAGARGPGERNAADEHAVARAVGETVSRLSRAGLYNRDHKPSNLIVTRRVGAGAAGVEVAVIDCVAVRFDWRRDGRTRMLASLVIEAGERGVLPRRGLLMRGVRASLGEGAGRERVRKVWGRVTEGLPSSNRPRRPAAVAPRA